MITGGGIPAGFYQHTLVQRVNHAHAVGALQDGLYDAGSQSAVSMLQLMPAQQLIISSVTSIGATQSRVDTLQDNRYLSCKQRSVL